MGVPFPPRRYPYVHGAGALEQGAEAIWSRGISDKRSLIFVALRVGHAPRALADPASAYRIIDQIA